jgi:hypothetical protein
MVSTVGARHEAGDPQAVYEVHACEELRWL